MCTEPDNSEGARVDAAGFESTHWTLVLEAARQDTPSGQKALATLYKAYWKPIYAFVRRKGRSEPEAEDLTQGFFAQLIEKNWLGSISQEGGKFRSVLLTAVKHFLTHAHERERALKRGGGFPHVPLDDTMVSLTENATPEREFEKRWALGLLESTLDQLRREYARTQKPELFEELKGFLSANPASYAEVAAKHDISPNAVGVAIHRLRKRYGELLRVQVARTVSDPKDVGDELRHLLSILAG